MFLRYGFAEAKAIAKKTIFGSSRFVDTLSPPPVSVQRVFWEVPLDVHRRSDEQLEYLLRSDLHLL
jgi:hypothetical protein